MKTPAREVYFSFKNSPDCLPIGNILYCVKPNCYEKTINPFNWVTISFHDDDEFNINIMEKAELTPGFMFWWNSPEGKSYNSSMHTKPKLLTQILENTSEIIREYRKNVFSFIDEDNVGIDVDEFTEKWIIENLTENGKNVELDTLLTWLKSDSVYTLLRRGVKSPSSSGIDDSDECYYDLYNFIEKLRENDKSKN